MYLVSTPISLLTSIVLARALGSESFGQYTFIMALLPILVLPIVGGLPQLLTREVASYSHAGEWALYRGVVRAADLWVILLSLIAFVLYISIGSITSWLPVEGKWGLLSIVILLVPLHGLMAIRNGTIKGLGFPALAELPLKAVQPIVLLLTCITLNALGLLTVRSALWAQVGVASITFVFASILFFMIRPEVAQACTPSYRPRAWLVSIFPFALISLVATLNAQVGIVMLGVLGNDEAVAALRIGSQGAQLVVLSLGLVNMVISPHIVKTYREGNSRRLQQLSRQSARSAFMLALPVGLILLIFGKPLINLAFGEEYTDVAYFPMVILVVGQLFNVALGPVGNLLTMSGFEKLTLLGQFFGLVTTIILALVLISILQEIGAALAVTAGLVVWNCIMGYLVSKRLNIKPGIL